MSNCINHINISGPLDLSTVDVQAVDISTSSIAIQFPLPEIPESLSDFYSYSAEYWQSATSGDKQESAAFKHSSTAGSLAVIFAGLAAGTEYVLRVVAWRQIAHAAFYNSARERGTPSRPLAVTTGQCRMIGE
jgi:hypothetical protein